MAGELVRGAEAPDQFARLHRMFVEHLGCAVGLAWAASAIAAFYAPWTRNIRGLIDPLGRVESTWSFLFALPMVLTLGWIIAAAGSDMLRRSSLLRNQTLEFALAGFVAFVVFCMAISRVVTALSLAS